ncbi:MAG: hypothetical protein ACW98Y_16880 [Candidatus Thorarchaeota archaeon]
MNDEKKIIIQNPVNHCIHSAVRHPVYTDHFITDCGMVVTTSATRHETNNTEFIILESLKVTCENCAPD